MTRILVVDDSPTMRRIIATNLKSVGFDGIDEAADGRLALIKMLRSTVDLLIVDWAMPEMTGLELLRALRSAPSLRDVPVLMITGVGAEEDIREALEAGVNAYIIKPFDAATLAEKVNDLVGPRATAPGGRP
jgi:two-component system chemotaxis response regulator CheY